MHSGILGKFKRSPGDGEDLAVAPLLHLKLATREMVDLAWGVRLHPMSDAIRHQWLAWPGSSQILGALLEAQSILTITRRTRSGWPDASVMAFRTRQLIARVVTALQLVIDCDARAIVIHVDRQAWFDPRLEFRPIGGLALAERCEGVLGHSDRNSILSMIRALGGASVNLRTCAVALTRWEDACARRRAQDVLVDSWIGLESLLLTDSPRGRITEMASVRLARLIGASALDAQGLVDEIRASYKIRSRVVHGEDCTPVDLPAAARTVRGYLRQALLTVLLLRQPFYPDSLDGRSARTNA